jgi:hypothetical protein
MVSHARCHAIAVIWILRTLLDRPKRFVPDKHHESRFQIQIIVQRPAQMILVALVVQSSTNKCLLPWVEVHHFACIRNHYSGTDAVCGHNANVGSCANSKSSTRRMSWNLGPFPKMGAESSLASNKYSKNCANPVSCFLHSTTSQTRCANLTGYWHSFSGFLDQSIKLFSLFTQSGFLLLVAWFRS